MEPRDYLELAHELVDARQRIVAVTAPSARSDDFSLADAYAVAALVDSEWTRAGHRRNGVKIGLTNQKIWPALGVDAPIWGRTYADTTLDSSSAPVDIHACVDPRLEGEVVVGLAGTLGPRASAAEVAEAIDWAALGFELVDSHVEAWKVRPADLVADFGAHAGLVIGPRRRLSAAELVALGQLGVDLINEGASPVPGRGEVVLGGPVPAIVAHLAAANAPILDSGSLVATGSLTGQAHPIGGGERWRLEPTSGPLPGLEVTLSKGGHAR
jgi:2-keto-4-pentenoate hydratase